MLTNEDAQKIMWAVASGLVIYDMVQKVVKAMSNIADAWVERIKSKRNED